MEEFVDVEAGTYGAGTLCGGTKRRCGGINGTGAQARSLGSEMGLFLSNRLDSFKFDNCRLKAPG